MMSPRDAKLPTAEKAIPMAKKLGDDELTQVCAETGRLWRRVRRRRFCNTADAAPCYVAGCRQMKQPGPNDRCPCGSGNKYKKCCRSGVAPFVATSATPEIAPAAPRQESVTFTLQPGLPGTRINFILHPIWKDPQDPRNLLLPQGASREYRVSFALGRSGGTIAADLMPQEAGDSFLIIPEAGNSPRTDIPYFGADYEFGEEQIHFDGYVNPFGRLAKLVATDVRAKSFRDAEHKALRALQTLVSQLAFRFNIPIHVAKTEILEISTGSVRHSVVLPYREGRFESELDRQSTPEFGFYASLYREALNSNSPVYQFLCFFKIVEGLRARRRRLASTQKSIGGIVEKKTEIIPTEEADCKEWLTQLFGIRVDWGKENLSSTIQWAARGKRFGHVIDTCLNPIRVGIAHSVLKTGESTLMADEALHLDGVFRWLGLTQCIARAMMKSDFPQEFSHPS